MDPPEIGEHGAALLGELGYSQDEIAGFVEERIVAFPT
jgi:crotonobetainyl-CoA:carnitine CoA-transferase CaiB-like acyl-CoA transferase